MKILKPTILHISFDYPDSFRRNKTKAIRNLVRSTGNYNHLVISINRISNPFRTSIVKTDRLISMNVFFFKYGIFLNFFLLRIAARIARVIKTENFDIIHSHKLTFEGVIGDYLARQFHKKHIVTVRGNTDIKVLRVKKTSRRRYRNILDSADKLISVAPWAVTEINTLFKKEYNFSIIPNISFIERFQRPLKQYDESNRFITAFVFERNYHRLKNLSRVLQAFKIIVREFPHLKLTLIGDGSQREKVINLVRHYKLEYNIEMPGYKKHDDLVEYLVNSIAFVMPSYPETFGLVYLEALSSGLPIIHSKKAGVDGFFPMDIALRVNHRSVQEISQAMLTTYLNQKFLKNRTLNHINSGGLYKFSTKRIVDQYNCIISDCVHSENETEELKLIVGTG